MADGSVILTEIEGQRLTRVAPDGKKTTVAETGGGPNGAAIGPDGAIYVTNNGGSFEWLKHGRPDHPRPDAAEPQGRLRSSASTSRPARSTTVYDGCDGRRLIGPNDLVFDKQGGFWFTDHGCAHAGRAASSAALYYAKPDGSKIVRAARPPDLAQRRRPLARRERRLCRRHPAGPAVGLRRRRARRAGAAARLRARPGGLQPARLPAARQPGGGGRRQGLRRDHHQRRHHRLRPGRLDRALRLPGPDHHQHLLRRRGHADAWITGSSTGKLYKCRWPRPGLKLNFNA